MIGEKYRNKSCQSIQIYNLLHVIAKTKDHCKAFCLTRKRKNITKTGKAVVTYFTLGANAINKNHLSNNKVYCRLIIWELRNDSEKKFSQI